MRTKEFCSALLRCGKARVCHLGPYREYRENEAAPNLSPLSRRGARALATLARVGTIFGVATHARVGRRSRGANFETERQTARVV